MKTWYVLTVAMFPTVALAGAPCPIAKPRIDSAFVRRVGRDIGNMILEHGVSTIAVPMRMTHGTGVGSTLSIPIIRKSERIWWHTESKVHRKCTDSEAAQDYGFGNDTATVTDELFNSYAFPWADAMLGVVGHGSNVCAAEAFKQAGRAGRDWLKKGHDRWGFYLRDVDSLCGDGTKENIISITKNIFRGL